MSSTQADRVPTIPASASLFNALPGDEKALAPVDGGHDLTPGQIREVVRLVQCPSCSYPLRVPVTLPCGKTLCRHCIPETHLRTNISYPATESRLQGFHCPFPDCQRVHALSDCSANVTLNKVLPAVQAEYVKGRAAALATELGTHIVARDKWEAAGVPSLRDVQSVARTLPGGCLLATYFLAEMGELDYHAEVTYSAAYSSNHADLDTAVLSQVKEVIRAEMDCQVCYALYYDAVTTPCGHTFCRICLQRVLDHASHCPVCRRPLSIQPISYRDSCPTNELIEKATTLFWGDILDVRRQAVLAEGLGGEEEQYDISIFACTLAFPSMPTFLHVFEPRYRLMIRRALQGNRTFGMVLDRNSSFVELGTVLRIVDVQFFPDGRSVLETVGVSRFRILRHSVVDGYTVAKIEKINDISVAEEEELEAVETRGNLARRESATLVGASASQFSSAAPAEVAFPTTREHMETSPTQTLMDFATEFVRRMRDQSVGWLTVRILATYGECPDDPAVFPWWFANILPVREIEKYRLLETTSVRERLKICCGWILEWEASR